MFAPPLIDWNQSKNGSSKENIERQEKLEEKIVRCRERERLSFPEKVDRTELVGCMKVKLT
jgi:hypothetical protein